MAFSEDRRVIFLTGSPLPSSLDWSDNALSAGILPSFAGDRRLLAGGRSVSQTEHPQWRSLPFETKHMPSGLTQATYPEPSSPMYDQEDETLFVSATELSSISSSGSISNSSQDPSTEDVLSQYYEHSFAIHEGAEPQTMEDNSFANASEGSASTSFVGSPDPGHCLQGQLVKSRLDASVINDLKQVPNAAHLRAILPQTKTVNLVVGIISIAQPRTIKTRRSQQIVELVEATVGDETRAGFAINFWLSPERAYHSNTSSSTDDLRVQTLDLRPRDIVLVRNVALGSFRGSVHGQSLRRGVTTLDLLHRRTVDATDHRGAFKTRDVDNAPETEVNMNKIRKVKDWVTNFVGGRARSRQGMETSTPLPLDTQ